MDKYFRYFRYYFMIIMGYTGKWLLTDTLHTSFKRWSIVDTHYTRHMPKELNEIRDYKTEYYWYSRKELLDNFHNSTNFDRDRRRDI